MDLENKNVLITGGNSGIGYALSKILKDYCFVHCWDKEVPQEIVPRVNYARVDITKVEDIRAGCFFLPGTIDVVVNNAGIIRRGTVFGSTEEEFDELFKVNVKGSWLVLKTMYDYRPGIFVRGIVQVSSMHAVSPKSDPALYTLTKQAGVDLVEMVARTYPECVVKIAYLGPVDTALARYGRTAGESECVSRHTAEQAAEKIVALIKSDKKKLLFDEPAWDYRIE